MIGKSGKATKDIQSADGMLHKNTHIVVEEIACKCTHKENNIKVRDKAGRIFWVGMHDILLS
jgi:hypothetical protein